MNLFLSFLIICFLGVKLEVQAEDDADQDGEERHPLVVNGQNADPHEWPWQIALEKSGRHYCGGSLISDKWVLTAAHCVISDPNPSLYSVVVGAHRRLGTTSVQKTFAVKRIRYHSLFNNNHLKYDVAILLLNGTVEISSKVRPIKLPSQGSRIASGKTCYITGWGRISGFGSLSNILQEAPLTIGSYSHCTARNGYLVHDPSMICAGSQGKGGCNGDSGGPLACNEGGQWTLRGVVSWGKPYCPTSYYTVFARVSSFITWINKTKHQKDNFNCNFEQNICPSWFQDKSDRFDWTRYRGPTPSSYTGPSVDHTTGSSTGYYMYIETSWPRVSGDTARLVSNQSLPATNQTCLSFWYHMYGNNINTLRVLIRKGAQNTTIWSKTSQQGNKWLEGKVNLTSQDNFQIIFEGIRGSSFEGDIAIDDISIKHEVCKFSHSTTERPRVTTTPARCYLWKCYNGGTKYCYNGKAAECICPRGYSGGQCQYKTAICPSLLCFNGGTWACSENGRSFCNCNAGYNGKQCQGISGNEQDSLKCYHCNGNFNCQSGEKYCVGRGNNRCAKIVVGNATTKTCTSQATCNNHCDYSSNCQIHCCSTDLCNRSASVKPTLLLVILATLMFVDRYLE